MDALLAAPVDQTYAESVDATTGRSRRACRDEAPSTVRASDFGFRCRVPGTGTILSAPPTS
jgi:hypothetical protein